jgi:lysophospholipase L1-like esterase
MKILTLVVRCILGLFLAAVALEISARTDDYLSYGAGFSEPYRWQILETEDAFGVRGRPGAHYQKWELNSLGYRGPELRPATVRVVCFGASETFGIYETENQEYPRQLENELNARFRGGVQVVNVAMAGQRVASAVRRVPEILQQVHPSFAIIYPSPQHYVWFPSQHVDPLSIPAAAQQPELVSDAGSMELRALERIRNLLKQALPSAIQTRLRQRDIDAALAGRPAFDRVPEENVVLFRKHVARLATDLRNAGVEPVLVTHATVFGNTVSEDDYDLLVAWRKFVPMLKEEGFLDMERRMNDAIRQVAHQDNIRLVDAARRIPPGRQNFADFSHFTNAGSAVMASLLAETLHPLIESRVAQQASIDFDATEARRK